MPRITKGYVFIAMPIDPDDHQLVDVLDAIKEAASRCNVRAERIDETHSNERITDRILESIGKAEYVIVDLTAAKPNVFYEAGYAHGLGKIPIYIARHGTALSFDLKDYPVIFFRNMKDFKFIDFFVFSRPPVAIHSNCSSLMSSRSPYIHELLGWRPISRATLSCAC